MVFQLRPPSWRSQECGIPRSGGGAAAVAIAAVASVAEAVVRMQTVVHPEVAPDGTHVYGLGGAYGVPGALDGEHVPAVDGAAIDQSDLGTAVQYCTSAAPGV